MLPTREGVLSLPTPLEEVCRPEAVPSWSPESGLPTLRSRHTAHPDGTHPQKEASQTFCRDLGSDLHTKYSPPRSNCLRFSSN